MSLVISASPSSLSTRGMASSLPREVGINLAGREGVVRQLVEAGADVGIAACSNETGEEDTTDEPICFFSLPPLRLKSMTRKKFLLLFLLLLVSPLSAKTVCLNMIVKDEAPVIQKCLESVKPLIDYWVIVDTGSTDGTQELIRKTMEGIPGELFERPWVNFEHNRNEALRLTQGKGDFVFFIDADEELVFEKDFVKPKLDKDYYLITVQQQESHCKRVCLINNHFDWRWEGVVHEQLMRPSNDLTVDTLHGVTDLATSQAGHRTQDPDKFIKDAALLEKALKDDPTNARYQVFLAQSYSCAGLYDKALECFQKRAAMGGIEAEVFWSLYMVGVMEELVGKEPEQFLKSYAKAYQYRPSRAEPLYRQASYFYKQGLYLLSTLLMQEAAKIPLSDDHVHVEMVTYLFRIPLLFANSLAQLGRYEEALALYRKVEAMEGVTPECLNEAKQNALIVSEKLSGEASLLHRANSKSNVASLTNGINS